MNFWCLTSLLHRLRMRGKMQGQKKWFNEKVVKLTKVIKNLEGFHRFKITLVLILVQMILNH